MFKVNLMNSLRCLYLVINDRNLLNYAPLQHKDNLPSPEVLLLANTCVTLPVKKVTSLLALAYIVHVISIVVCATHLCIIYL